ncbi:MAG TPA: T9SS type A sorting domain-containing protein, partial [Flavobacteriales bacterium]|nr:T9SS type A sorting domain-containing protein [Flavobacteriales bacterium]
VFHAVSAQPLPALCADVAPLDLAANASPEGGVWSGPGMSGSVLDLQAAGAGEHVVTYTVFDPDGCASSAALNVHLYDAVAVSFTAEDLIFCAGDGNVQFTAQPAGGTWSAPLDENGVLDASAIALGNYPLVYTWAGPNGCTLVNPVDTIHRWSTTTPIIDPIDSLCNNGLAVFITGSPVGAWSGSVQGDGAAVLFDPTALGAGVWPIQLTAGNAGECPGTATAEIVVDVCMGLAEVGPEGISVGPNPFTDQLWINVGTESLAAIELVDATGRKVASMSNRTAGSRLVLDLPGSAPGTYILRCTTGTGLVETQRLVRL